jgi:hypothetical protein
MHQEQDERAALGEAFDLDPMFVWEIRYDQANQDAGRRELMQVKCGRSKPASALGQAFVSAPMVAWRLRRRSSS